MLAHRAFGTLRLSQFTDEEITPLENWEFMGHLWVGEAIGFSEWLRLQDDQDVLRSLALDFAELPDSVALAVLEKLRLPLRSGMTLKQLRAVLGEPVQASAFVKDRDSYDSQYGTPDPYLVSCTVLRQGGLTYLVVTLPLPKA